jgi:hypothetical protein
MIYGSLSSFAIAGVVTLLIGGLLLSQSVASPQYLSRSDMLTFAAFFDAKPYQGGQVSPRYAKWLSNETFLFLQFDGPTVQNSTELWWIGTGKKGVFCSEDRPGPGFVHFDPLNAAKFNLSAPIEAGAEGYWMLMVATDTWPIPSGFVIKPGVAYGYFPQKVPSCGQNYTKASFKVPGEQPITRQQIAQLEQMFDDKILAGGQVPPWPAKYVNDESWIFIETDQAKSRIVYFGVSEPGTFCSQSQPTKDFSHFHKTSAAEYELGHGGKIADRGHWMLFAATSDRGEFNEPVNIGNDPERVKTPPPEC